MLDFSGLKDKFQVFDQSVILSRSEEREDAAACLPEGDVMAEWSHQQRDRGFSKESLRSLMNRIGWGLKHGLEVLQP